MTQVSSNFLGSNARGGIVFIVGMTLFMTTWGVHQFRCPERASQNGDAAPETIKIVVLEGKCSFSAKSNESVSIHNFNQEFVIEEGGEYELNLESEDYVYSLHQPELSLNVIAVPDMVMTSSFQAKQSGRFEIELSPMCGFPWKHEESPGVIVIKKRRKGRCD